MVRLVQVVPVVLAHPAVPVAHRARHLIARPAGTEFIDVREDKISLGGVALPHQKKENKNERFVNFTFDHRRMDFSTGVAIATSGSLHLNEACLSGQGQEENT